MKREGRQHGMVRSYAILPSPWDPKPKSKIVNKFDSPPTAGLFVKVPSKPTNHSKFTGKCGKPGCNGCHTHPATKSKDKTKGTQKLKANNVTMDHRSLAWRVVDKGHGLNYGGKSATGILCHMSSDDYYDDDEVDDDEEVVEEEEVAIVLKGVEVEAENDDVMSFCDAGFVWDDQLEGDEGWCVIGDF